jgi:protein-L-isoaspartate(D-aspartate) O-methyltransferase
MERSLDAARRWYAENLRIAAPVVHNEAVVEAFAQVPRERFCGEAPWRVYPRRLKAAPVAVPEPQPAALYHDVLVVIDEACGINIGQPSLWAYIFDQLRIAPGHHILQVGAGTGYYTAILADIVGPDGQVEGIELEGSLAERAREALQPWPWASMRQGNGVEGDGPPVDVIVVCAGATHPARGWLERLAPGGRLMVPLTTAASWGFLLVAERISGGFKAASLGPCGYVHCEGARRPDEAERLQTALTSLDGRPAPVRSLHLGKPAPGTAGVWLEGEDYWLSTEPPAISGT